MNKASFKKAIIFENGGDNKVGSVKLTWKIKRHGNPKKRRIHKSGKEKINFLINGTLSKISIWVE